ncbi:MAG: hypothetical protein GY757_10575 [bacterium]|nr:hypothetical protein [bacterium]
MLLILHASYYPQKPSVLMGPVSIAKIADIKEMSKRECDNKKPDIKELAQTELYIAKLFAAEDMVQLSPHQTKTLNSLKRIKGSKVYIATYYGGYGFDEFLKRGMTNAEAYDDKTGAACTTFAAVNPAGDSILAHNGDGPMKTIEPVLFLYTNPPGGYASICNVGFEESPLESEETEFPGFLEERINLLNAPYWSHAGMNQCGVAIAKMMAVGGRGPTDPAKPIIGYHHAIRLVLDYARDVDAALSLLKKYNNNRPGQQHYLIADTSGSAAVVDYNDGKIKITRNKEPWLVASNFRVLGAEPQDILYRCGRYRKAYKMLRQAKGISSSQQAMTILKSVSIDALPWWQSDLKTIGSYVFNMTTGDVHIARGMQYDNIIRLRFDPGGSHRQRDTVCPQGGQESTPGTATALRADDYNQQSGINNSGDFNSLLPLNGNNVYYYANGEKKFDVSFKDNKPHGSWTMFRPNGRKIVEFHFNEGKKEGPNTQWYEKGTKKSERYFVDNHLHGKWTRWYENGNIESEGTFQKGNGRLVRKYSPGVNKLVREYSGGKLQKYLLYYGKEFVRYVGEFQPGTGEWKWEHFR